MEHTKVIIEHCGNRAEIFSKDEAEIAYLAVKAASAIDINTPTSLDWIENSVHSGWNDDQRVGVAEVLSRAIKAWSACRNFEDAIKIEIDVSKLNTNEEKTADDKANIKRLVEAVSRAKWDCKLVGLDS